jgi:hypothetical protein
MVLFKIHLLFESARLVGADSLDSQLQVLEFTFIARTNPMYMKQRIE